MSGYHTTHFLQSSAVHPCDDGVVQQEDLYSRHIHFVQAERNRIKAPVFVLGFGDVFNIIVDSQFQ